MPRFGIKLTARLLKPLLWVLVYFPYGGEAYLAAPATLSGIISSHEEGRMEGVLVSAKREGSIITVTVVSDSHGRYAFPGDRLPSGSYRLKTRAVGYDLDDPGTISINANKTLSLDLALRKTNDLASQLSNAEWFMSAPGVKETFLDTQDDQITPRNKLCIACHPFTPIMQSRYDAKGWLSVLSRMNSYTDASIFQPGELSIPIKMPGPAPSRPDDTQLAEYLSGINLSASKDGKWKFELKTLPRPRGKSTKVIITEYDLPRREWQPHDAIVDREGMVWFVNRSSLGGSYLGRLNPRNEKITQWRTPVLKAGFPEGSNDIKLDMQGNLWIPLGDQEGLAKFDRKTEKFTTWRLPTEHADAIRYLAISPDGTIWLRGGKVHQLDPRTGDFVHYPAAIPFYGVEADSRGNAYLPSLRRSVIGELNAKTGRLALYPTPTPKSGPRRGEMDRHDRLWFAEYFAGRVGMFDTATKQFREWSLPYAPWTGPYDVMVDKNGEVWAAGEFTDNIFRLNPVSGQVTAYLLPTLAASFQRVDVDSSTTPVTVWVGEQHKGKIARIEPLR